MSSSSEEGTVLVPLAIPELRTGVWTRFGSDSVLGDTVTEQTLSLLAESARVAAESQGYAIGWTSGRRAANEAAAAEAAAVERTRRQTEDDRAAEHTAAVAALEAAALQLRQTVAGICATIEEQAGELALELTRTLVGHEVAAGTVDVVRRVLDLTPGEPVVRVSLHPADAAGAASLTEAGVIVLTDQQLSRGDALVEAEDHVLDLRISTAMDRISEALR